MTKDALEAYVIIIVIFRHGRVKTYKNVKGAMHPLVTIFFPIDNLPENIKEAKLNIAVRKLYKKN